MAWQQPGFCIGALKAAVDMASNQFKCVKGDTTNGQFALCNADGEVVLGILQDNQGSGLAGDIMCTGVSKITAAETLVAGDSWGTDANGLAKKIEKSITGADVGDYAAGIVLEGAAVNELATVTIGFPTFMVEAQ